MPYPILLLIHNALRWLVLGGLLTSLGRSAWGWLQDRSYQPIDQTLRVVTTSLAHTQLLVGFYLYTQSPIVKYFWTVHPPYREAPEFSFFGLIHISLMLTAIIVMTIGSSKAKRQSSAQAKFKTTVVYFVISLLLIFIAIPWPFSPLANRPLLRTF